MNLKEQNYVLCIAKEFGYVDANMHLIMLIESPGNIGPPSGSLFWPNCCIMFTLVPATKAYFCFLRSVEEIAAFPTNCKNIFSRAVALFFALPVT